MELISEEVVEETWQECAGFSKQQAQREIARLSRSQPNLLALMLEFTEELAPGGRELAVYMFVVVSGIFQKSHKKEPKKSLLRKSSRAITRMEVSWQTLKGPIRNF